MTDQTSDTVYVDVILPLALPRQYTYTVPKELEGEVGFGKRVEVPLRNKRYSGLIVGISKGLKLEYKTKDILGVIDDMPIITEIQFKFWEWIAKYYCCTIGEVMLVALPAGLKLTSETKIVLKDGVDVYKYELTDDEFLISEAIEIQNELTIEQIRGILGKKTVYPVIKSLMEKGIAFVKEELQYKFKPKTIKILRLSPQLEEDEAKLSETFDQVQRSDLQTKALLAYIQLRRSNKWVPQTAIYHLSGVTSSVINALIKKDIFIQEEREVSRLDNGLDEVVPKQILTPIQENAIRQIKEIYEEKDVVLLHGVTGSGKTNIYIELIEEAIARDEQVLFLLPEIALTAQIVARIKKVFGDDVGLYHSKMSDNERVELFKASMYKKKVIVSARSGIFLPFQKLGLIIVDEEHDASYKQNDPNPRYHGRDVAIYLATSLGAKVLLGSATPSLESYYNCKQEKYGLVKLSERFGDVAMPELELVDLKYMYKTNRMQSIFSLHLLENIKETLARKEQVLIFQNRRGYAPTVNCELCGWTTECVNCDVTLTLHKYMEELRCHYCGYRIKMPPSCPACGNPNLNKKGYGTEKIELELKELLPEANIKRMDYDTAKTKNQQEHLITDFEERKFDILIGTQMITKGLDFENLKLVGVVNADSSIHFPDFRAHERAYQMLTQVSGRAGRKGTQGKVILQSFMPNHQVLKDVVMDNYDSFYAREIMEREQFLYPPFFRTLNITLRHKKFNVVEEASRIMASNLKKNIGSRLMGPAQPSVARVRGMYIMNIFIKMEKNPKLIRWIKDLVLKEKYIFSDTKGFQSVRVKIDVDPY
ncbi:replication restart helicase PriA [Portibacter lacus]|uniref:Replication restart protein PriA n=1 Tax=Portibacter lacus TaxID=1099794 RepID=A0AA37SL65_9BACT|nr:primosomal protein N' [Portibacter lacus]GLR15634.1 primosomal protein N' [Portibacter lacus]